MEQIYKSIRTYLTAAKERPAVFKPHPSLIDALFQFEHRNRGHQHLLSDPVMGPNTYPSAKSGGETLTRRVTLCDTSEQLMTVISDMPESCLEDNDALNEALTTPDTSGWLAIHAPRLLPLYVHREFPRSTGYRVHGCTAEIDNGKLNVSVHLNKENSGFHATRRWTMAAPVEMSLRSLRACLIEARRTLKEDFEAVATWPELSGTKVHEWLLRDAKEGITKALRHYPKEHLQVIANNWDLMKPFVSR